MIKSDKYGFTYVEILITMTLLMIFLGVYVNTSQFNVKIRNKTDEISKMALVAQGVMDAYKELGYTEAFNYTQGYTVTINEDYNPGRQLMKKVIVTVSPKISGLNVVKLISYCYTTGYVILTAKHSGKVLEVPGSSTADGTVLGQYTLNYTDAQRWKLSNLGTGYYSIINKNSSKYIDVNGASTDDGTTIIQYTSNGGTNQQWDKNTLGTGYVRLIARHSSKVAEVTGSSLANGAQIVQRTWNGGDNQQWKQKDAGNIAAILYANTSYGGTATRLEEGSYTLAQLQAAGMTNDTTSSVRVTNGYKVTMYKDDNFLGTTLTRTSSDGSLWLYGFDNMLSSVKIIKNS